MVREIIHDPFILGRSSAPATKYDMKTADDLRVERFKHKQVFKGIFSL